MNSLIIFAVVVAASANAMHISPSEPKLLTPNDAIFQAVVQRAERAINDANKNDLYLMKATSVRSVSLTLDSPASKVYDVEFEAVRTTSPKGTNPSEAVAPANGPVSVCNVKLAFHPWLIHAAPATTVVNATCQPKDH